MRETEALKSDPEFSEALTAWMAGDHSERARQMAWNYLAHAGRQVEEILVDRDVIGAASITATATAGRDPPGQEIDREEVVLFAVYFVPVNTPPVALGIHQPSPGTGCPL